MKNINKPYNYAADINIHTLNELWPKLRLTELVMVFIILIFILIKDSTIKYIWTIDHFCQRQASIFIRISLKLKNLRIGNSIV